MTKWTTLCGAALAVGIAVLPAVAQEAAKKEPPKPAASPSQAVVDQWNDIGRKLIAMAEDFPEDKYEYKPKPEQRSFREQLLHASDSTYFFTNPAMGQKMPTEEDPSKNKLKTKAEGVADAKKSFADGAAAITANGNAGSSETIANAHGAVFEIGGEPGRIARGRDTRLAGADDGDGLVGGKMRKRFFEGTGKSGGRGARHKAQDGFAETVDAMSSGF